MKKICWTVSGWYCVNMNFRLATQWPDVWPWPSIDIDIILKTWLSIHRRSLRHCIHKFHYCDLDVCPCLSIRPWSILPCQVWRNSVGRLCWYVVYMNVDFQLHDLDLQETSSDDGVLLLLCVQVCLKCGACGLDLIPMTLLWIGILEPWSNSIMCHV